MGLPSVLLREDFLARKETSEEELNICYVSLSRVSTHTLFLTFNPLSPSRCKVERRQETVDADDIYDDGWDEDKIYDDLMWR